MLTSWQGQVVVLTPVAANRSSSLQPDLIADWQPTARKAEAGEARCFPASCLVREAADEGCRSERVHIAHG